MDSGKTESAVEKEIEKTAEQINSFDTIVATIDRKRYRVHHIDDFRHIVLNCRQLLNTDLRGRLRSEIKDLETKEQIKELDTYRSMMGRLAQRLYDITANSLDIPYELYSICDNFLDYYKVQPQYIIYVSDEIALTPFSFILQDIKFEEEYFFKEFWNQISQEEFYFVQIVSDLAKMDSSIDWPVVLHEIGHMICSELGFDDRYFKGTSVYDALMTMLGSFKNVPFPRKVGVPIAAKKLYGSEFLADYLVTRCYGPTFGWRFARRWVNFRDIYEPSRSVETHPEPEARLKSIINEVKTNLGMPEAAAFLEKESAACIVGESDKKENKVSLDLETLKNDVEKAIAPVKVGLSKHPKFVLTPQRINESIATSMWSNMVATREGTGRRAVSITQELVKRLADDLLKGKPIVVDPPVIYYLLISECMHSSRKLRKIEEKTDDARMLREFIADLVRLYYDQSQFKKIRQTKRTLQKELQQLTE
jgi:hypothetical protein